MATTGIWKVEKRLDHVLDYVMNPEKTTTDNSCYQELHQLDTYNDLDYNSEFGCYISGLNCLPEQAYKDMMDTKNIWNKNNGVLAYHAFQSFKEGEVTADKAHKVGLKLAQEMWGDRFEIIVTTHVNTNHIHNHFVINSVSFKDGKKYHDCRESMALLRHTSDSLCQEFGLSVVKEKKVVKVNYDNYYRGYVDKNNYHTMTKKDIDKAIAMAYSYKDFETIMNKMGYELTNRYGKLSVRGQNFKKNIRIMRAFGEDYSIDNIEKRIETTHSPRVPFIGVENQVNYAKTYEEAKKQKAHGIYGLYKYYCYLLKVYPKQYPKKVLTPALRMEVEKMNEISEQTRLLVSNKIETREQFLLFKDKVNNELKELTSNRDNLWKKIKRVNTEEDKQLIQKELLVISHQVAIKRKEVRICDEIDKKLDVVKENIREFEEEKGKERIKYEF